MSEPKSLMSPATEPEIVVRERRIACQNSKWQVFFDTIESRGKLAVSDYLVVSPQVTGRYAVSGVCVLPVLADGRVVLLRNYRHPLESSFWECVRGFIDAGEEPGTAARRELEEETGLACRPDKLVSLGYTAQEPSTLAARVALYAALDCRLSRTPDADELGLGAAHPIPLYDALRMANDGIIEDATTLIALYRYSSLAAR